MSQQDAKDLLRKHKGKKFSVREACKYLPHLNRTTVNNNFRKIRDDEDVKSEMVFEKGYWIIYYWM